MSVRSAAFALLISAAVAAESLAQVPRVFVASNGVDAGVCPRTAPCRNFAYAMTQVAAGGEIVALDTAGYGPVTITRSVTIYSEPGAVASITAATGNDITIAAGLDSRVVIRGLFLNSTGSAHGISFESGTLLSVSDTTFTNFAQAAFDIRRVAAAPNDFPRISVNHCKFSGSKSGLIATTENGWPIHILIRDSQFEEHVNGIAVGIGDRGHLVVTDSTFLSNQFGLLVETISGVGGADADAVVDRCTFLYNGFAIAAGASIGTTPSVVRVANSVIAHNSHGVSAGTAATIVSRLSQGAVTNTVEGNDFDNGFGVFFYNAK